MSKIVTDKEPIPGTNLYRQWENAVEVQPIYHGPKQWCFEVQEEADSVGHSTVEFAGLVYARFGSEWFIWGSAKTAVSEEAS